MWRINRFVLVVSSPSLHICIRYDQRFIVDQFFHPFINCEVKGWEPHVVTFVVPNVSTSHESIVLAQRLEGGSESRDVEDIMLIYDPPLSCTTMVT